MDVTKSDMIEFAQQPEMDVFMHDVNKLLKDIEAQVMRVDLSVTDDRQLALTKARAEGARKLTYLIEEKVKQYKSAK